MGRFAYADHQGHEERSASSEQEQRRRRGREGTRGCIRLRRRHHRIRVRRIRRRAAPDREGLPGGRARGRPPLRGQDVPQDLLAGEQVRLGAAAGAEGPAAHPRPQGRDRPGGRRGRRWFPDLREHPVRTAQEVLPGPRLGAHHRLGPGIGALLRPGLPDARRDQEPDHDPRRRDHEGRRRRHGRGTHLLADPRGGLLRRRTRRPRAGPLLRRRRSRAGRLHPVRRMHDRVPSQRQEHVAQELPGTRGEERCRRVPPHHRDHPAAAPGRRLRGRHGEDRSDPRPRQADLHRRPGRGGSREPTTRRNCCTG